MRVAVALRMRARVEPPAGACRLAWPWPALSRKRWWILGALTCLAAVTGSLTGVFVRLDMPRLERLEEYAPAQMTRLLGRDGAQVASFGEEKRILLGHGQIPPAFRNALIASEDSRFHSHAGIDLIGAARALVTDLRHRRIVEGASTLSMQLAGNLYLDRSQRTWRRKVQEVVLALEIERRYSKEEILRFYVNQVYFGHGLYGLESAARFFFGKAAGELTVSEAATLVGLLPRPASYSPLRDIDRATQRRNLVLGRMAEEGYLTADELKKAVAEPLIVTGATDSQDAAPYFNEEVRRWLQERYGTGDLYRGGLQVRTTLDTRLQEIANRAVASGLAALDARQGKRRDGNTEGGLAQAALLALDPKTGEILAMVGGSDFARSQYNRATQARRQTGSLFKSFVFAAAINEGRTLADTVLDEPTVFLDPQNPVPYQPENFHHGYYESITLRTGLEKSANIATVKLLEQIGYDPVLRLARELGIHEPLRRYPSLALGAFELTLLEVTSAYGAFASGGLRFEPYAVREVLDGQGRRLHRSEPRVTAAVSPQVAYVMNRALTGVLQNGTGKTAGSVLRHTLAGKTGTTDDSTDAWFVGYSPELVVGVWVGFDDPASLGDRETGARAALPIWTAFMREALADRPDADFPAPAGIVTVAIDPETGLLPAPGCNKRTVEVFIEGSEPTVRCSHAEHRRRMLPYPLERYPLATDGTLAIPEDELRMLLLRETDFTVDRRERYLIATDGTFRIPLTILPPSGEIEPELDPSIDSSTWFGTDGRRARVVWFDARTSERVASRSVGGR